MRSVKDKVTIITGCSRGIGAAIAAAFARQGAKLVLCGRSEEKLNQVASGLGIPSDKYKVVHGDLRQSAEMKKIVNEALTRFGVIDILVNNAGVGINKPIIELSEAEYDQIFETNLKAVFYSFKEVLPVMLKQGFGQIINISSSAARIGQPGLAAYAASKAALNVFSEAVAGEVRNDNIKISVLAPASTDTGLMSNMSKESRTPSRAAKKLTVDEVAEAVLFLAQQNENAWTSMADIRPLSIKK